MNKLQNWTVASKSVKSNYGHDPYIIIIIIHDKGNKAFIINEASLLPFHSQAVWEYRQLEQVPWHFL